MCFPNTFQIQSVIVWNQERSETQLQSDRPVSRWFPQKCWVSLGFSFTERLWNRLIFLLFFRILGAPVQPKGNPQAKTPTTPNRYRNAALTGLDRERDRFSTEMPSLQD